MKVSSIQYYIIKDEIKCRIRTAGHTHESHAHSFKTLGVLGLGGFRQISMPFSPVLFKFSVQENDLRFGAVNCECDCLVNRRLR